MKGSVAECWNKQQEQAGHPERCIRPFDRLVSVNGKTGREEIKGELASQEVVLEFHRVVPQKDAAPAQPKAAATVPSRALSEAKSTADSCSGRESRKPTFQDAFSAYLQAVTPAENSGAELADASPATSLKKETADVARISSDAKASPEVTPDVRQAQEDLSIHPGDPVTAPEAMDVDSGMSAPAKPLNEAPYGLVVQILSLGSGSVRLSWAFSWDAAPSALADEAWAARCFQAIWRSKASGDAEHEERTMLCHCPQVTLELPVGHLYTLQVQAVITDMRAGTGEQEAEDTAKDPSSIVWTSPASQAVSADLRRPVRCPVGEQQPAVAGGIAEQTSPPRVNRTRVAAGLGSFLEQGAGLGPVPEQRAASSSSAAPSSAASRVAAPIVPSGPGGLAAGPGAESPERPPPVVMGPVVDPLTTAKPLLVTAKPLDPAAEKRDISERLRIRHGASRVALQETSQALERKRSQSMDSDDEGSLMRLSHALSSLERTAATKSRDCAGDSVAQEGYHSLQLRLEPGPEEPVRPASPAKPSAAATFGGSGECGVEAVAVKGQRLGGPTPVVRPAHDSADDANFEDYDSGGPAGQRDTQGRAPTLLPPEQSVPTPATQSQVFQLSVQVSDDKASQIEFVSIDDLPRLVEDFLAQNKVKDLFKGPLLRHLEMMRDTGRQKDSVDIVDLLD